MILDQIRNADSYYGLGSGIRTALTYLQHLDADAAVAGSRTELEDGVFALCGEYTSCSAAQGVLEAHKKYIDVMIILQGTEEIGYKPVEQWTNLIAEYSDQEDVLLAREEDGVVFLPFGKEDIAIWFAQDGHMPCISRNAPQQMKRVVVKVPVESCR